MRGYVRLGSISCGFVRNWRGALAIEGLRQYNMSNDAKDQAQRLTAFP